MFRSSNIWKKGHKGGVKERREEGEESQDSREETKWHKHNLYNQEDSQIERPQEKLYGETIQNLKF